LNKINMRFADPSHHRCEVPMMRAYHPLLDAARSAVLDSLSGHVEVLEHSRQELALTWGGTLAEAAFAFAFAALEHEEAEAEKLAHQNAINRCGWKFDLDGSAVRWCAVDWQSSQATGW
jgi:hypothetical protein